MGVCRVLNDFRLVGYWAAAFILFVAPVAQAEDSQTAVAETDERLIQQEQRIRKSWKSE
jgi:hypothetical protein